MKISSKNPIHAILLVFALSASASASVAVSNEVRSPGVSLAAGLATHGAGIPHSVRDDTRGGRDETKGADRFAVAASAQTAAFPGTPSTMSVILGRPTDTLVAISVLSSAALNARVEYGTAPQNYTHKSEPKPVAAGVPVEFELTGLKPDTHYHYRIVSGASGAAPLQEGEFQTQRAPGTTFTFSVQGDSHPERAGKMFDSTLYAQTMKNIAADKPDFHFLLGDDFSIERLIGGQALSQASVNRVYAYQRDFLGTVGREAALFLVNGNHEQAARCNLDGTPNSAAVCAGRARTAFYPLPAPDRFYSGDSEEVKYLGLPRDYYSWTWGDALFIVIDPYWHSPVAVDNQAGAEGPNKVKKGGGKGGKDGKRDLWAATLGDAQYQWLYKTLTESRARWKFVFCHHVLGTGRGGVEMAGLYEWGGRDRNGGMSFAARRPNWPLPIHDLLVKTGVTAVFQGHDHLYARQELDGVVYQSCPNPADRSYQAFNSAAYRTGQVLPNSGHIRVTVAPDAVRVDYLRASLPGDEASGGANGTVAASYSIPAKPKGVPR